jgi:predicted RNase H-like HicB family nuclease
MTDVTVKYHQESEGWWAETDLLPTFSAAGESYEEVRDRVRAALPDLLGGPVEIYEDLTAVGAFVPAVIYETAPAGRAGMTIHASVGRSGTSVTRLGTALVGAGNFPNRPGQSDNHRLELA